MSDPSASITLHREKVQVYTWRPEWDEKMEAFALTQADALFYHSLKFRRFLVALLAAKDETLVAVDQQENIVGYLPLLSKDGPLGIVYNSLPFYGSHGGIVGENKTAQQALIQAYNELIVQKGVIAATVVGHPISKTSMPIDWLHCYTDQRIGQWTHLPERVPISAPKDALMWMFRHNRAWDIRKAQRIGIQVDIDNDQFTFLEATHRENIIALNGLPKSHAFFALIPQYFKPDIDYRIFVAKLDGKAIAALLVFYYGDAVEYFVPAIDSQFRDQQPLSLIIFEAMCHAIEHRYRRWNWGGTWISQKGVYDFKKRWNAQDYPYSYYIQVNDDRIFTESRESLLAAYEYFFVIPFQYLKSES